MEIIANGTTKEIPEGTSLAAFIEGLDLPSSRLAVEHNGAIVPRGSYGEIVLSPGDRIEVVTLVGGG